MRERFCIPRCMRAPIRAVLDDEPINRVIDARTGKQPQPITLTAEDGRELSPEDLLVVQSRAADPVDAPRRRAA